MKYMGSKRAMLSRELGRILLHETSNAHRFIDLFAGSAAVAWHVAQNSDAEVIATDLQQFAVTLANAVISRNCQVNTGILWTRWCTRAEAFLDQSERYLVALRFEDLTWSENPVFMTELARQMCGEATDLLITPAYGGYYFSPKQALELDALRATLPRGENRSLACAALIQAASECAASPGHTAQPFKPSATASKYLFEQWKRSVFQKTYDAFRSLGQQHARTPGSAHVHDAVSFADNLNENDVAFIDPPYSGVHYSRFYHVLETIARGQSVTVSGEGRYPPPAQRPRSDFSITTRSRIALDNLLNKLSERGVRSILTFPSGQTSNNLSGTIVEEVAGQYFNIERHLTNGRFSTLGGNLRHRTARMPADEIILVMQPI